ncbi:MAG: hypothetical protein IPO19_22560 [Rhodoferax sp.]|nr:hypothetical protein [Rhodoferax sp.]
MNSAPKSCVYSQAEHWRVGTIARQPHLHRDTVTRVLSAASVVVRAHPRARQIDLHLPFITETPATPSLEGQPPASSCSKSEVATREAARTPRHPLASLRPRREPPRPTCACAPLPGEQAQVDWAHFGHRRIGRAERPLTAFVMSVKFPAWHLSRTSA